MNILLISDDFYPNLGGVANVLFNIYKFFQDDSKNKLIVINPYTKGKNLLNILGERKYYSFKDFPSSLKRKEFNYFLLYTIVKILCSKNIPYSHKWQMILFLFRTPNFTINIIENVCRLYPSLKKIDFDIIVSGHSYWWNLVLVFILSRIFNKKIITFAYGSDFLGPQRFKSFFFRNVDKIILITNQMKKLIKKIHHLPESKLIVNKIGINPLDLETKESSIKLREELDIPKDTFIILSVGRHVPRKNFDLVIKAIYEIKKLRPNIKIQYLLIGEGPQTQDLKKLSIELKLKKLVIFLGKCDLKTRNKYYKLSDVFIMPSSVKKYEVEGFGIVFLEANFFKLPVIGTFSGGISEAVSDKETGFLIKPNDLEDLIQKILFLYDNPEERKKMGEKGYERVMKDFLWGKIINDYVRVFKDMINE